MKELRVETPLIISESTATLWTSSRLDVMPLLVQHVFQAKKSKRVCSMWNCGKTHTFLLLLTLSTQSTRSDIASDLEAGQSVIISHQNILLNSSLN